MRLAEAVPADDAARRELALLGVRRVAREAAAQRSGASAKRLSSLSATTASFSAQPRGCAAGVDQRFDVVPLQRPVGGSFAVVCVCVSCAVCAHASPVGSLCVRAPVSRISPRAHGVRINPHHPWINPTPRINPPDTGLIHHPRINPTPRINPPDTGFIHIRRAGVD